MFKTVKTAAQLTVAAAQSAKWAITSNREMKARQKQMQQHDAMIAESQAKIGPYKPAAIPVQVWA